MNWYQYDARPFIVVFPDWEFSIECDWLIAATWLQYAQLYNIISSQIYNNKNYIICNPVVRNYISINSMFIKFWGAIHFELYSWNTRLPFTLSDVNKTLSLLWLLVYGFGMKMCSSLSMNEQLWERILTPWIDATTRTHRCRGSHPSTTSSPKEDRLQEDDR